VGIVGADGDGTALRPPLQRADQFTFFLPSLALLLLLAGVGLETLARQGRWLKIVSAAAVAVWVAAMPVVYAVAPDQVERSGRAVQRTRNCPSAKRRGTG